MLQMYIPISIIFLLPVTVCDQLLKKAEKSASSPQYMLSMVSCMTFL